MESLHNTEWDVLIAGTGLPQSLLALALSRSGKRVLHVDKNDYYGGPQAVLSTQEAEAWVMNTNAGTSLFSDAALSIPTPNPSHGSPKLSFPRAYSLALAPQLIYTQSGLLSYLLSSKVYRQLEFLAMGSWWIYSPQALNLEAPSGSPPSPGQLIRIPATREDVAFSDTGIDLRSKRAVMKVLRFVMDYENQAEVWQPYSSKPLSDLLTHCLKLPSSLHSLFLALTLTLDKPQRTTTSYALPRIARHLRSMGRLGAGFSAVIPKWGGMSELTQVACRAGAVGGGVYVLGKGITTLSTEAESTSVLLGNHDTIRTKWIVGAPDDLGPCTGCPVSSSVAAEITSRSIAIVSSSLESLFPTTFEGSPKPAGAVVVFPVGSLGQSQHLQDNPVYLLVHSSDTGECPVGQSIIYGFCCGESQGLLESAIATLLTAVNEPSTPHILWSLQFKQHHPTDSNQATSQNFAEATQVLSFPPPSSDLVFDDSILDSVKSVWERITESDADRGDFLVFGERGALGEEYDEA
ncbi:hypothetical protein EJ06DRAFT_541950 [Trichodelitschia bisporula]|uniref:Rab proteins geranylgeranyltransferase n=1 Tax=Trichodelitschia bisporula TaxID=703511 RepID=A0A6G1I5A6_9PEZI|nr:hypothetical protein EJ06DRAFT_541950 [Trichodelitschia bisporula]